MANRWLFKEEPHKYSYDDLVRDGQTVWDGVRNNWALKNLREARAGDEFLYYHTGKERAVVGIGRVASDPYVDPAGDSDRLAVVDVEPVRRLDQPVTLAMIKQESCFESSPLVRMGRLSVVPITAQQWKTIEKLGRSG